MYGVNEAKAAFAVGGDRHLYQDKTRDKVGIRRSTATMPGRICRKHSASMLGTLYAEFEHAVACFTRHKSGPISASMSYYPQSRRRFSPTSFSSTCTTLTMLDIRCTAGEQPLSSCSSSPYTSHSHHCLNVVQQPRKPTQCPEQGRPSPPRAPDADKASDHQNGESLFQTSLSHHRTV